MVSKPNTLYVGPDKAGSTWLYMCFRYHYNVHVSPAKDTQYFGQYYHRTFQWYKSCFDLPTDKKIVAEISHNYLYNKKTPHRISKRLDRPKILIFLREPVSRAISSYRNLKKHDLFRGTFREALQEVPHIKKNGMYHRYVPNYIKEFGPNSVKLMLFDDLKDDTQSFFDEICSFLGIQTVELPVTLLTPVLPASSPRSRIVANLGKKAAIALRSLGFVNTLGRLKTSKLVNRILFDSIDDKPEIDDHLVRELRDKYKKVVQWVEQNTRHSVCRRWDY